MIITSSTTFLDKARSVWNKYISSIEIKKSSSPVSAEAFGTTCLRFSPLWCRIFIGLWAVAIITWSSLVFRGPIYFWPIYMTHWGLLLILSESIFGIAVALAKKRGHLKGDTPRLPWYVKVYWVLYNTSIAVAFLITTFYWSLLYGRSIEIHFVLDLNLHGINSALMALELILAAHPSRLVHCYQPATFGLLYVLFGVVYFFAGGVDPFGHPWIYPVVDWTRPGPTSVVLALTALSLALAHVVVVAAAALRDALAARCRRSDDITIDEVYLERDSDDAVV